MRSLEEARKRWDALFPDDSFRLDLREAVKDPADLNPCKDGLRSICWKAFLLYGPMSQSSWPKKISDSRSAYSSLRDHFLRYIDHPDDLQSSIDPLADDDNSPWASLRQDEVDRGEILQDIERCMQDNFYFREPSTQKKLLDILFIYAKLNPDTGYRQGMHELLAPILWTVDVDAIDTTKKQLIKAEETNAAHSLVLEALDSRFVEHDAFNLFCAVMQTAKLFYEVGDSKTSPLVARSRRIHEELLMTFDPELAHHLQVIEILPQIYLIRWMRLLFGREFAFDDVLSLWDSLFAENLSPLLVDMTCVAMLLRIRWQLLEADYSGALSLLLHYSIPSPCNPSSLVGDAKYLDSNRSNKAGALLIRKYSGRGPESILDRRVTTTKTPTASPDRRSWAQRRDSPQRDYASSLGQLPTRVMNQQKALEGLFQEVSGGIQRRTEGWSISKAVKGAVGEVRRNVNSLQYSASPTKRTTDTDVRDSSDVDDFQTPNHQDLAKRIEELEDRNKVLAKMLGDALESLRGTKQEHEKDEERNEVDEFNISIAKIQFIQVYLADSSIPIPEDNANRRASSKTKSSTEKAALSDMHASKDENSEGSVQKIGRPQTPDTGNARLSSVSRIEQPEPEAATSSPPRQRPRIAESSFSFMLGEDRRRSSFVSSATVPPEQRRDSGPKSKLQQNSDNMKVTQVKKDAEAGEDSFTMSSLRGT